MLTSLVLLVCLGHNLPAWEILGPEGIGYGLTSVVQSYTNPQELYCVGGCSVPGWWDYGNYIYHSDDGGVTWAPIQSPKEEYIAGACLEYTVDGTLLIRNEGTEWINYSTDMGENWAYESLPDADNIAGIVSVPTEPQMVWAVGTSQGKQGSRAQHATVWRSTNSGQNWSACNDILTTPAVAYELAVSPSDIQTLCVAGTSNSMPILYKSLDGTGTWESIVPTEALGNAGGLGVAIHPTDSDVIIFSTDESIYRTTNGGLGWDLVSSFDNVSNITYSLINPSIVTALSGNQIVMSVDAGVSWVVIHTLSSTETVYQVLPSVSSGTDIFAVTSVGFILSTDTGSSWSVSNGGISLSSTYGITDAVGASSRMYMFLDGEFSYSDDMGFSWTSATTPSILSPRLSELCRNPLDDENVVCLVHSGEYLVTQDAGNTWATHTGDFSNAYCIFADPSDDGKFYIGGRSPGSTSLMRIGKTEDSGATWSFTDLGDSAATIYSGCVDPSKPDTVYVAGTYRNPVGQILLRTFNGGDSWHTVQTTIQASAGINSISVSHFNSSLILAGTQNMVYRSDDFGLTWEEVSESYSLLRFVKFDPYDPDRAWMMNDWYPIPGIGVSVDGGLTWEECNDGLPYWKSAKLLSFSDPGYAYVATGASLFRLNLSSIGVEDSYSPPFARTSLSVTPNPVVSSATISYISENIAPVKFSLFDISGRIVEEKIVVPQVTGMNILTWDFSGIQSCNGVYFLRMDQGNTQNSARMVICSD